MSQSDIFQQALQEGTRLLHVGSTQKAIALLEKAHSLNIEHVNAALNLAGAYILANKHSKAVHLLEAILEANSDNVAIWINLGAAYLGNPILATNEKQLKAINAFQRALAIDPQANSVHYNLGLIYRDRGEQQQAIDMFRQALDVNPNDDDALRLILILSQSDG